MLEIAVKKITIRSLFAQLGRWASKAIETEPEGYGCMGIRMSCAIKNTRAVRRLHESGNPVNVIRHH